MIDKSEIDGVCILRMDAGQNQLNQAFVAALAGALEEAAERGGPLVLTGTGKVFSNGLDLDWLSTASPEDAAAMFRQLHAVLARLLRFPGATVAAVNGHAFGAGVIIAAAADFRVQRADRGYVCLPEVDLGLVFTDEFDAVLQAKLPPPALLRAVITGHRYGGQEALAAGLVDGVAGEEQLLDTAVGLVRDQVDKPPATVVALKAQQHRAALAVLDAGS